MKLLSLFSFILIFSLNAYAQHVSLTDKELDTLSRLIKTDMQTAKFYTKLELTAKSAIADAPAAVDTLFSEGLLAGNPKKIKTLLALKDVKKAYALAMAYRIKKNKVYLDKAVEFIKAWAVTNKPQGNPINDTKLDRMIEAYDLIKNEVSVTNKTLINSWLLSIAAKEVRRKLPFNNWNSHRIKMIGMVGFTINDTSLQHYTRDAFEDQIEKNLYKDGSGFDFTERDALHYHVYTLEPLLKLAIIFKHAQGTDYYHFISKSGSSISKSVWFLVPYVSGEQTHAEFVNSKVAFDRARANNNEPNFKTGASFNPEHGFNVISLSSYFQPDILDKKNKVAAPTFWQYTVNGSVAN